VEYIGPRPFTSTENPFPTGAVTILDAKGYLMARQIFDPASDGRPGLTPSHLGPIDLFNQPTPVPDFDGNTYCREFDYSRLKGQVERIYKLMRDGNWRTLGEIEDKTGDSQASISAQLRNLRKEKYGSHKILRQARGLRENGLYEYKLETR
jgi:hypothetical protein